MPNDKYYQSPQWEKLRTQALRIAGWKCSACGVGVRGAKANQSRPLVDHIVPRKKGGSDAMHNLRVLCLPCHNRKTTWEDLNTKVPVGLDGLPEGWR